MLGLHTATLARYVAMGKLPAPQMLEVSGVTVHAWTEAEIENVRQLLPKVANGRKTRYQKLREKKKAAQPRAAVPHKTRKPKKK
jgi:predicted DNA-binding transcriptional regulator AlpA